MRARSTPRSAIIVLVHTPPPQHLFCGKRTCIVYLCPWLCISFLLSPAAVPPGPWCPVTSTAQPTRHISVHELPGGEYEHALLFASCACLSKRASSKTWRGPLQHTCPHPHPNANAKAMYACSMPKTHSLKLPLAQARRQQDAKAAACTPALPDLSDAHLNNTAPQWLAPHLVGCRSKADCTRLPWAYILKVRAWACMCVYASVHAGMHVRICKHMHVHECVCVCVPVRMHLRLLVLACVRMCMCTFRWCTAHFGNAWYLSSFPETMLSLRQLLLPRQCVGACLCACTRVCWC